MATVLLQHPIVPGLTYARRINAEVTGNSYLINAIGQVSVDTRDEAQFLAKGYFPVGGAGGVGNGIATMNFGAFPGSAYATVTVSGVDVNDPYAAVDAWIAPIATADHSRDEHIVDPPMVSAYADGSGNLIIVGVPRPGQNAPIPPDPMPYGAWSVGWAVAP